MRTLSAKQAVTILSQVSLLFVVYEGGEWVVQLTDAPLPGSVAGMAIMLLLLMGNVLPVQWVEEASALLLRRLPLFFLPALVGLADNWSVVGDRIIPLLVVVVCSTLAVMLGSAGTAVAVGRRIRHAAP